MVWQNRVNRIATWCRWAAVFAIWPEVAEVIYLHFPIWLDIALPVTFVIHQVAGWFQRRTEQYRIEY